MLNIKPQNIWLETLSPGIGINLIFRLWNCWHLLGMNDGNKCLIEEYLGVFVMG